MFRTQVIVSTLGATRLYRGLVDFPMNNSSAKVASSDAGRVSGASHQPRHEAVGGLVVLDTLQVTVSVSEVQTAKAFEGGNIV